MTAINGMAQQRLDEIQLRLIGVDHRPWHLSHPSGVDDEGRRFVSKGSRKAMKHAVRASHDSAISQGMSSITMRGQHGEREGSDDDVRFDSKTLIRELALFHRTNNATDDMLNFVAHAPKDVEDLLTEVFCLREMVKKLKEGKDEAVKELLSKRVEASRAEEKIIDMRRAWRTLCKEMGTRPVTP